MKLFLNWFLSLLACSAAGTQWRLVLAATLLLSCTLGQAASTNRLFLTWDNSPDYDTNITFFVFSSIDVALPATQWGSVTNVDFITFTNAAKVGEFGRVEIPAATDVRQFYVVTASNFTGMGDFSEPVSVRRLLPGSRLRIGAIQ